MCYKTMFCSTNLVKKIIFLFFKIIFIAKNKHFNNILIFSFLIDEVCLFCYGFIVKKCTFVKQYQRN